VFVLVAQRCRLPIYHPVWKFLVLKKCPYNPKDVLGVYYNRAEGARKHDKIAQRIYKFCEENGLPLI